MLSGIIWPVAKENRQGFELCDSCRLATSRDALQFRYAMPVRQMVSTVHFTRMPICPNFRLRLDDPAFPLYRPGRPANLWSDPLAWIYLVIAGLFEMGWAVGLKYTDGFTRLVPTALTVAAMIISVALLGVALRELPVGTGYAVWTGIGTVGTAVLGMYLFGDPVTVARLLSIGLIVAGIAGLKFLG